MKSLVVLFVVSILSFPAFASCESEAVDLARELDNVTNGTLNTNVSPSVELLKSTKIPENRTYQKGAVKEVLKITFDAPDSKTFYKMEYIKENGHGLCIINKYEMTQK